MKILIVSDIHGNVESLSVLPHDYDEMWVLGDLVNYGPDPGEVIDFVKNNASIVVRGNHDNAIGFHQNPRCSPPFRQMAEEMARVTEALLSDQHKLYLRDLPVVASPAVAGTQFCLCHAAPTDPLFAYCPPESDRWPAEIGAITADILFVGHTHIPFVRDFNGRRVVNPGSLGQPKIGKPEACFAVWEDGRIDFHSVPYPYWETINKLRALDLPARVKEDLEAVLETGNAPHIDPVVKSSAAS